MRTQFLLACLLIVLMFHLPVLIPLILPISFPFLVSTLSSVTLRDAIETLRILDQLWVVIENGRQPPPFPMSTQYANLQA